MFKKLEALCYSAEASGKSFISIYLIPLTEFQVLKSTLATEKLRILVISSTLVNKTLVSKTLLFLTFHQQ